MENKGKAKKILKNTVDVFYKASLGVLAANAVFFAHQGYVALKLHSNHDKGQRQIASDLDLFEGDFQNYIKDRFNSNKQRRLAHNGKEPIYVKIDKNFTEEETERIKNSFTYMENIFKDINPNYHFAYVDNNLGNILAGKATIDIEKNDDINSEGLAHASGFSFFRSDYLLNSKIVLRSQPDMSNPFFDGIVLHEILHLFQLGDVYEKDVKKEFANTFVYFDNARSYIPELTPQDYKTLNAIYNKNYVYKGNVDSERLAETVNLIKAYEQNYYNTRYDFFAQNLGTSYNFMHINEEDVNGKEFIFKKIDHETLVELKDGKFKITVTHLPTNKVVSSETGKYIVTNGAVVLQNVNTYRKYYDTAKLSSYPRITDFMMMNINGEYRMADVYDMASGSVSEIYSKDLASIELRNKFFENKDKLLWQIREEMNTYTAMPSNQKFSIEMDEELDTLGLFR